MLSAYQLVIIKENKFSLGKSEQLISNLNNKKKNANSLIEHKTLFRARIRIKKNHRKLKISIEIQTKTILKTIYQMQYRIAKASRTRR